MDCSQPGFSVHGISQARIPEWVAISFSRGSSLSRDQTCISCIAGGFFFFFFLPLSHLESPLVSIGEIQFCLSPFSENDRHSHPKKLLTNLLHLHLHPLPLFSSSCALLLFQKNNYISGNMCVKHLQVSSAGNSNNIQHFS